MASKNFFGVFSLGVILAVAGCDAISGLFGGKPVARREPKAERPLGPTSTPGPSATPWRTPEPTPSRSGNATTPTTTPPDSLEDPTPVPVVSPSATPTPWLTGRLADGGNGLQKLDIQSGGFGMDDQRQNIFAIAGLDGEMYFLVYRWYLFRWGNDPGSTPEVYWKSGAASFRLKRILGDNRVEFDYVGLAKLQKFALSGPGPLRRLQTISSLVATLPGTPSDDVVLLPAYYAMPSVARLSEQAGGRWGGDQLLLVGLPWYPDDWYPTASGTGNLDSNHRGRASSKVDVDHAVGYRSAFAFRYNRIEPNWYFCSTPDRFDRVDCDRRHTALDVGPLWRLNKGEAEWKPLQTIPRKSSNQDGGVVTNTWNQVWWSDVHRRWFFWVGAAYGDVYLVTEEAAAKLP